MSRIRSGRPGFSLTEILMAVGILGVGLTMVASVFPVAVDQHRRGRDSTMAALCARSVAATMRAARQQVVKECREYFNVAVSKNDPISRDRPAEYDGPQLTGANTASYLPTTGSSRGLATITQQMRVYNPQSFLYESGRVYDVLNKPASGTYPPFWPFWNAGNYVPVIYVTPLVNNLYTAAMPRPTAENPKGPWRVTIVVFKSRGREPTRTKHWAMDSQSKAVAAGGYILNRSKNAGEAHLIDYVRSPEDTTKTRISLAAPAAVSSGTGSEVLEATSDPLTPKIASPPTSATAPVLSNASEKIWYVMPGAVGAFHTIIGD
jgi:prepilin-type N-terminal cleavage/methylation domain-containing protein